MSAPKFIRKLALLAVVETIVGTLVVPVSANAIEVSDVTLTPIEGDEVDQNLVKPYFGASETIMVTEYRKVAFSVGLAGVAALGTLPGYTALMRGCAASATNTPGTSTVFLPVTDGIESLSFYAVVDKLLYKMAGARGNCKSVIDAKGIPKWQFDFTGSFIPVEDVVSMPAVDYTAFMKPLGVNKANTTLSFDGISVACSSFQFDFGNKVVKQDLMNVDTTEITGRTSTGSVKFRNTDVATKDWIALARTSAKVPLLIQHGQAATNTVSISVPLAQVGKPSYSDDDGIQMITVPFRCIPSSAGNDEWSIEV
ncbi:MAG: hypothetical protein ABI606_14245 [Rhodoferax sp.]